MHGALLFFALTGSAPGYSELPSGHTTVPPESQAPPASIAANEKVPGFFVATPSFPNRRMPKTAKLAKRGAPAPTYVVVVGTAERKQKVESGEFNGSRSDDETGPCFSQARSFSGGPHRRPPEAEGDDQGGAGGPTPIRDWNEGLSGTATINVKTEHDPNAGVIAVHRERLVTDATGTRLEIDDAWVDPATKGVRKLASTTLPLKLVQSSRGLEVWAAREERADGTKLVQFVIIGPRDLPNGREALSTTHGDGRNTSSSSCSHLRVAMSATDGDSDSAILRTTLRLPDVERKDDAPRAVRREAKEEDGEDREDEVEEERRARVREAAIQLGVSKTTRDKEPILSVTFGWSGRETSQIVRNDE